MWVCKYIDQLIMNSLGFDKKEKDTKVIVAMSGGVDSAVAAVKLKQEGYDITGVTLRLYNHPNSSKSKSCCAGIDIEDAKKVVFMGIGEEKLSDDGVGPYIISELLSYSNEIASGEFNDTGTTHSPIIGYAFDNFPIYGAYGYADINGGGGIKRMESSYQLRNITNRINGPSLNQHPLGAYIEDFEYISGLGDLDEHNGRYCVTPEYPNGTYAYFVTIDASLNPVYPYTPGPYYYGIAQGSGNIGWALNYKYVNSKKY